MNYSEQNISGIPVHTFENPKAVDRMKTICIGGAISLPKHFSKLAEHWGLTHVLDNPVHKGDRKRSENWQDELFDDMYEAIETLRGNDVVRLVGHSRGNLAVSELASRLNLTAEVVKVREIVAINPPLALPGMHNSSNKNVDWDTSDQRKMDLMMGPLCYDMTVTEYGAFVKELCTRYSYPTLKDVYNNEIKTVSPPEVARTIAALESQTAAQTMIIMGDKDPWNIRDGKPIKLNLSRIQQPVIFRNGGHYLPKTQGDNIAELVSSWSWGVDVQSTLHDMRVPADVAI